MGKFLNPPAPVSVPTTRCNWLLGGLAVGSTTALRKLQLLNREWDPSMLWLLLPEDKESRNSDLSQVDMTKGLCTDSYLILGKNLHEANEFRLVFDVGPLGSNKIAGHGHADALSLLLQVSGVDFLVDSGNVLLQRVTGIQALFP